MVTTSPPPHRRTEQLVGTVPHTPPVPMPARWWTREQVWPGAALLLMAAAAWGVTLHAASMESIDGTMPGGILMFLSGWAVMMLAMMLPATLPVILFYRTIARRRRTSGQAVLGMWALLAGYMTVWTLAGLPVYGYASVATEAGAALAVLPGLLLIAAGAYQFTALKRTCHSRCSNPVFFVTRHWRPGASGAARMGVLHGLDCLGCCAGLMLALVALGMMHVAWMLTAAAIIYVEKTVAGGHRMARFLGLALVAGGLVMLAGVLGGRNPLP